MSPLAELSTVTTETDTEIQTLEQHCPYEHTKDTDLHQDKLFREQLYYPL